MKCPSCAEVSLMMTERQGIEIDYCPQCRGVWLDRGELDRLIEWAAREERAAVARPEPLPRDPEPRRERMPDGGSYGHERHRYRRKSWLGELLDFD